MNRSEPELAVTSPQVIFAMDLDGCCTLSVGPGLEGLGLGQNDLVGANLYAAYDHPSTHEAFRRVLAGESFTTERHYQGRTLCTSYHPVLAPGTGAITGAVGVTSDVTEQRRTAAAAAVIRERNNTLVALSNSLALEVLDPESVVQLAVRSATVMLGTFGIIWLRTPAGDRLEARAAWHEDSDPREAVSQMATSTRNAHGWLDVSAVEELAGPSPFEWPEIEARGTSGGTIMGWLAQRYGPQTGMRVPLRSRGRMVGLIELARPVERGSFASDEVALAAELGARCALALENALLLQEQPDAREELLKFKALADASRDLIAISHTDETAAYLNPVIVGMGLGTPPGTDLWNAFARKTDPHTMATIYEAMGTGTRWAGEVCLEHEGEQWTIHGDVFPLYHPDSGVRLGMAWIGQDVTGLRESETALRAANADLVQFRALVEASPDFIAIAGLNGEVRYVNPAGRELIGLDPSVDVADTTIVDYLSPEGIKSSLEVEQPAVRDHGHWEGESTLQHQTGDPIPVAIVSFLMRNPETSEPVALVTVQRDISERIEAERALRDLGRQRESLMARLVEAEEAERSKIADNVHDDSVQAMAAVDLRLGLLERRLKERAPDLLDTLRPLQDIVSGATERLRELLFDLEAPDLHDGLANALVRAADHLFEDTATEIRVTASVECKMPEALRSVAYRIAREALVNARKHAAANLVQIEVGCVDGGLRVRVTDDGSGLPRASGTGADSEPTARERSGHYGLSGMRDRAAVVGGHCEIEPAQPHGTGVTVWLPGPPEGPSEASTEAPAVGPTEGSAGTP